MILSQATAIAQQLQQQLAPCCLEGYCAIAGSVRRRKPEVHDIELVCIPVKEMEQRETIFGSEPTGRHVYAAGFVRVLRTMTVLQGNVHTGKAIRCWYQANDTGPLGGVNVEIYVATPKNWGYILFIRTGPKEMNKRAFAKLKQLQYVCAEGAVTRFGDPVDVSREEQMFQLLHWQEKDPQLRA